MCAKSLQEDVRGERLCDARVERADDVEEVRKHFGRADVAQLLVN